jgi:hypothetical protein
MTEKEVSQQDFLSHTRKEEEVVIFYLVEHGQVSSGQFKLSRDIFLGPVIHERQTYKQTKKSCEFLFLLLRSPLQTPFLTRLKNRKEAVGDERTGSGYKLDFDLLRDCH